MTSPLAVCRTAFSSSASTARPSRSRSACTVTLSSRPSCQRRSAVGRHRRRISMVKLSSSTASGCRNSGPSAAAMTSSRSAIRRSRFSSPSTTSMSCPSWRLVRPSGEQLGMTERDGDRRAELVRGVLEEPALGGEQPGVLLADPARLLLRGELAPGVPHHGQEHGRHERDLGQLGDRLGAARHVHADGRGGRRHDHAEHRQRGPGRPGAEPVHQREADPDEVEGDGLPAGEREDRDQVDGGERRPHGVQQGRPERPAEPDGGPAEPRDALGEAAISGRQAGSPHRAPS